MELSEYWRVLAEEKRNMTIDGRRKRTVEQEPLDRLIPDGQAMSLDVYLAVPTFIRRGITIKA